MTVGLVVDPLHERAHRRSRGGRSAPRRRRPPRSVDESGGLRRSCRARRRRASSRSRAPGDVDGGADVTE